MASLRNDVASKGAGQLAKSTLFSVFVAAAADEKTNVREKFANPGSLAVLIFPFITYLDIFYNFDYSLDLFDVWKGSYGIVSAFGPHNLEERVQDVRDALGEEDSTWVEVSNTPLDGKEDTAESLLRMWDLVEENPGIGAVVSVVGLVSYLRVVLQWSSG